MSGLAMSVGWGFRSDYGHEAGAMVPGALLGLSICLASGRRAEWWFLLVGLILSAMILAAIVWRHRQDLPLAPSSDSGRGQLLSLVILCIAIAGAFTQAFPAMAGKGVFFVHVTFWITGGICSLIVLGLSGKPMPQPKAQIAASDQFWKPGMRHWVNWLLVPVLIILLAYLTVSSHDEPIPGSHLHSTKNVQ